MCQCVAVVTCWVEINSDSICHRFFTAAHSTEMVFTCKFLFYLTRYLLNLMQNMFSHSPGHVDTFSPPCAFS